MFLSLIFYLSICSYLFLQNRRICPIKKVKGIWYSFIDDYYDFVFPYQMSALIFYIAFGCTQIIIMLISDCAEQRPPDLCSNQVFPRVRPFLRRGFKFENYRRGGGQRGSYGLTYLLSTLKVSKLHQRPNFRKHLRNFEQKCHIWIL